MVRKGIGIVGSLGLFLIILSFVLFENSSEMKIGYYQTMGESDWQASFSYFKGLDDKELTLSEGEQVVLIYSMDLLRGALEMCVKDSDGNQVARMIGDSGEIALIAEEEKSFVIEVIGKEAKGSYRLSWDMLDV
ncbi:MAG: hypothetical protein FWG40_02255 [Peptococcaceae bacterium]|nr:hypothetical protein [Peptococcaceae bacterium]